MFDRESISNGLQHLRSVCWRADYKSFSSPDDQSESGAALVEFTILMPVFFMLLFGIIEFGSMIWLQSTMTSASREGARSAAVQGGSMIQATQKACKSMALSSGGQDFSISATDQLFTPGGTLPNYCEVTVNVSLPKSSASLINTFFTFSSGTLSAGGWNGSIGAASTMRREDIPCAAALAAVPCTCSTAGGTPSGC